MANLKLIETISQDNGMTLQRLADKSCIPYQTIKYMIETGEGTLSHLERMADVLHVKPVIFFLSEKSQNKIISAVSEIGEIFRNFDKQVTALRAKAGLESSPYKVPGTGGSESGALMSAGKCAKV